MEASSASSFGEEEKEIEKEISSPQIGPQIPKINNNNSNKDKDKDNFSNNSNGSNPKLISKLNHFFDLRESKGLSLNHQLAAHPDFHAPGITESLLDVVGLDPWGSNLPEDVAKPSWESAEPQGSFDYLKVAQDQRLQWESKTPSFRK